MKIDTTTIEGYESMTAEEKLAALEGFEYEDGTDEIARLKAANTKASKEAAEWKRKHNALLDDDEKKQQEAAEKQQQMEQELETLRREKKESAYKAKLLSDGYDDELAQEMYAKYKDQLVDLIVDELLSRVSSSAEAAPAQSAAEPAAPAAEMSKEEYDSKRKEIKDAELKKILDQLQN